MLALLLLSHFALQIDGESIAIFLMAKQAVVCSCLRFRALCHSEVAQPMTGLSLEESGLSRRSLGPFNKIPLHSIKCWWPRI
jgi:hypothetical protein